MAKKRGMTARRRTELKKMLDTCRRALTSDLQGRMRDVRSGNGVQHALADEQEVNQVRLQEDVDLALIQVKSETLSRIDAALRRLEAGMYGDCVACGNEISQGRLSAMPFAVRCTACEKARERPIAGVLPQSRSRVGPNGLFDGTE